MVVQPAEALAVEQAGAGALRLTGEVPPAEGIEEDTFDPGRVDRWAVPLPPRPPDWPERWLDDDTRQQWTGRLLRAGLLVLVGHHRPLLEQAAYDLVEGLTTHQRRFAWKELTTENLQRCGVRGHDTVVLFSAIDRIEDRNTPWIANVGDLRARALTAALLGPRVSLVLLVCGEWAAARAELLPGVHRVHLSTLRFRAMALGITDARDLERRVEELRRAGRWTPSAEEEARLLHSVSTRTELEALVAEREAHGLPVALGSAETPLAPSELVAAYAAAFYPDLSAATFDRIVRTLLSAEAALRGEEQGPEDPLEQWRATYPTILERAGLAFEADRSSISAEAAPSVARIRFHPADRALATRRWFLERRPLHFLRFTEHLCRAGGLFDDDERLGASVARNLVEMARRSEGGKGRGWILELVRMGRAPGLPVPDPTTPAAVAIQRMLADAEQQVRLRIYDRLRLLVACMLSFEDQQHLVRAALEDLLADPYLRPALPDIAWHLRAEDRFDAVWWLRRVIDNGDVASAGRAAEILARMARRAPGPVLRTVAGWLPPSVTGPTLVATPGTSGRAAVDLFVAVAEGSTDLRRGGVGEGRWPPSGFLLSALAADGALAETLVGALCHPAVDNQLALRAVAHLVEHVRWRLLPPEHLAVFGERGPEVMARLEDEWIAALQRSPLDEADPLVGRSLPLALAALDWSLLLPADPAPAPGGALLSDVVAAMRARSSSLTARRLMHWWSRVGGSAAATLDALFRLPVPGPDRRAAWVACRDGQRRLVSRANALLHLFRAQPPR